MKDIIIMLGLGSLSMILLGGLLLGMYVDNNLDINAKYYKEKWLPAVNSTLIKY